MQRNKLYKELHHRRGASRCKREGIQNQATRTNDRLEAATTCKHKTQRRLEVFPERWFTWEGFSLHQKPDAISLQDLVILDLRNSSLPQLWNGSMSLKKLKILNLHSLCLKKTPDFSCLHLPNLERLSLEYCTSLVEIHSSIGELTNLVQLSLKGCTRLEELRMLPVKLLAISGCTGLHTMPNQSIESLEELYADEIEVDRLAFGFSFSVKLCWWCRLLNHH